MGQCCRKQETVSKAPSVKQNKNIDDKRMLQVGIEVMKKDFCVQIGYNRRAVKTYSPASDVNRVEDLEGSALRKVQPTSQRLFTLEQEQVVS